MMLPMQNGDGDDEDDIVINFHASCYCDGKTKTHITQHRSIIKTPRNSDLIIV